MTIPVSEIAVDRLLDALEAELLAASDQEIAEAVVGLASTPQLEVAATIAELNAAFVNRLPGAGISHPFSRPMG